MNTSESPDPNRHLNINKDSRPVDVPVFSCVVYVSPAESGGVKARVANLHGIAASAATEREVLGKIVAAFKSRISESLQNEAAIPWLDPPLEMNENEQKRLIPVHL